MADSRPKKGLDEMLPDELLIRATGILNRRFSDWPIEFSPDQIARLMAGGHRGELKTDYDVAFGLVLKALVTGALVARKAPSPTVETPERPMIRIGRDESGRRVINCAPETPKAHTLYVVDRQACAEWLKCRGDKPGRYPYIDAWLRAGDERYRIDQRIDEIIRVLSSAGYDVMSIPDGGKKYAEAECLKNPTRFTDETFRKAWSKASVTKRLAMNKKAIYNGGR